MGRSLPSRERPAATEQPYSVQRLRGGWAIVWIDPTGKRHRQRLSAADHIGAQAEARQRWSLGQRGPRTMGDIIPAYITARAAAGIASTSRQKDAWKQMRPFWEGVWPDHIDEPMCRAYAERRAGRSNATIRYELSMVSVALRWAQAQKLIAQIPAIWQPPPPDRRVRNLTRAEFRLFFAEVKAAHARLFMQLALATCARPGALLDLTWQQVDFTRGLIDLNPPGRQQTAKRRPPVPMADWIKPVLEEAWQARQGSHVIEHGGEPIASIKKAFAAASERSGIKATPYTLRHTAAVWRAEDGIPMAELAQLMGHADSRTTEQHYARYSPDYLRKAANAGHW